MPIRCCEFVDSRLRRSPPDRASAVSYGQAGANATRFPHLAHRSAAAHKLHRTNATTRYEFDSGEGETFSRQPALAYSPRKLSKQPEPSHGAFAGLDFDAAIASVEGVHVAVGGRLIRPDPGEWHPHARATRRGGAFAADWPKLLASSPRAYYLHRTLLPSSDWARTHRRPAGNQVRTGLNLWREMASNHRSLARKSRFLSRKANCGTERGSQKGCFVCGTDGSNPSPSSGESSAN
jgi:hypothetical protein